MKPPATTIVAIIIVGLLLNACDKQSEPTKADGKTIVTESIIAKISPQATLPPKLVVETTSPDLAVKSWWKFLDLKAQMDTEECNKTKEKEKPAHFAYLSKVAQADVLRVFSPSEQSCMSYVYDRDIQEVKAESETRSIVFAKIKNVTPVPVGAEPSENDKKWRDEGFRLKYLVEKTSEGWKVSQVYKYNEFRSTYLDKDPWEKIYEVKDKPSYPSFVHYQ